MAKVENKLKNIIKIRDGVYEIQISNGYRADGKRDRITEYVYGDEDVAMARRDQIKKEIQERKDKGINTANDGYTFLDVAKSFINDKQYGKRVGTTIRGYKTMLNNYILPELGKKKLRNITTKNVEQIYNKMATTINKRTNKPLSGTTIKHTHTLVKTIFNYSIHKQWTYYNPAEFVNNKPKADTLERDYYDHDEIIMALDCLDKMPNKKNGMSDVILSSQNIRFKTAIILLFNTGLRREELVGLQWRDIKPKTHTIEIRRAIVNELADNFEKEDLIEVIAPRIVCKKLKNNASRRNIIVPNICFEYLNEYKKDQQLNGYILRDVDYVFQNVRYERVLDPNQITKEWNEFIKNFNLKKITIHDIRHSHATDLLSMGVPIQDVSRRLGHSDVGTTLKIYTHSNLEQDKIIASKLEERYTNN